MTHCIHVYDIQLDTCLLIGTVTIKRTGSESVWGSTQLNIKQKCTVSYRPLSRTLHAFIKFIFSLWNEYINKFWCREIKKILQMMRIRPYFILSTKLWPTVLIWLWYGSVILEPSANSFRDTLSLTYIYVSLSYPFSERLSAEQCPTVPRDVCWGTCVRCKMTHPRLSKYFVYGYWF